MQGSIRRKALIVFLAAALCTPAIAGASSFSGGIVVQGETFDPQHPDAPPQYTTLYDAQGAISYQLQHAWSTHSDQFCSGIKNSIGGPNQFGHGVTLYDISCTMGDASNMRIAASPSSGGIHLSIDVPGNSLHFHTTQPTACGSECDPQFTVRYDAHIAMDLVPKGIGIAAKNAVASARQASVHTGGNVASDLLAFVNELSGIFAGHRLLDIIGQKISARSTDVTAAINGNLGLVNALLAGYAKNGGYTHVALTVANTPIAGIPPDSALIRLSADSFNVPLNGNGTISGAVRWDKTAGAPSGGCRALKITALATVGYRQDGQLITPQTAIGQTTTDVWFHQNGDAYECDYRITGLPYNIPLHVSAGLVDSAWTGPLANMTKYAQPDGWSGTVTIMTLGPLHHAHVVPLTQPLTHSAVQLNPQPLPPGRIYKTSATLHSPLRVRFVPTTRVNPRGYARVSGIDFVLAFEALQ